MNDVTYIAARRYACPDGHVSPQGTTQSTIVPDELALGPVCTVCRRPMRPAGDPLTGTWRAEACCVPAGPGGTWAGPPRDPAACSRCFGTRRAVICTACLLPGCAGSHEGTCGECDGEGIVACETCGGDGHVFDRIGQDKGLCPNSRCIAGSVRCPSCGGAREVQPIPAGLL
jgi:hypothetical protein